MSGLKSPFFRRFFTVKKFVYNQEEACFSDVAFILKTFLHRFYDNVVDFEGSLMLLPIL